MQNYVQNKKEIIESNINTLKKQLNYNKPITSEYLKGITTFFSRKDDNEIYVFFKEAPLKFKTLPKLSEIQDFFKKNPVKKTSFVERVFSGCDKCNKSGLIFMTDKNGYVAFGACDCSKGKNFESQHNNANVKQCSQQGYSIKNTPYKNMVDINCPWHNAIKALITATKNNNPKAIRGGKKWCGLNDDDLMAIISAHDSQEWDAEYVVPVLKKSLIKIGLSDSQLAQNLNMNERNKIFIGK